MASGGDGGDDSHRAGRLLVEQIVESRLTSTTDCGVPARTVRTSDGTVGYRIDGSGGRLVLIMGYSGSMDAWRPSFVDILAKHHRVVIFDNAGIGQTQALPSPLSITAMADQTSALIAALQLGPSDVLGWSMGGMIAQALAVRHPDQLRRLVLCATLPGNGQAVPPSASAVAALTGGNPSVVVSVLFPADHAADQQA